MGRRPIGSPSELAALSKQEEPLRGYRNGYEPGRLRTAEGEIVVQKPQVREWVEERPYRSRLMTFLRGHSDVLES